jgi:ABC-type branched-subunit amino acid transport system substrate-binding protein
MSERLNRRTVLKGVGAAGMAGLAGCTDSLGGGGGGGGGRTVKQGVLMPLTGDLGSLGKPIRDGATLPAKFLEGKTDFSFDVQVEDTQTNPQAGISAAENLINAGYPAVTGPASSGVNIQVSKQAFIPNEVVGCSPSSTSPAVTGLEDNDYIFRTPPSDTLQGQVIARVGENRLDASSAATMYVNNDYGQALSESFASNWGGEVQGQVSFEKEQSSYTSQLEQALGGDPDMLVVIGYPASGIQLFRDYYSDFDNGTQIVVTDGLIDNNLPKEVDNSMDNVLGTAPKASGPGVDAFNQQYQDEYGREPGVFNAQAYDASAVCMLANVYAGENNGTGVRDNMRKAANPEGDEYGPSKLADAIEAAAAGDDINYVGASSAVDFDDNGDMKAVTYAIYTFSSDGYSEDDTISLS